MPKKSRRFEAPEPVAECQVQVYRVGGYVRLSVDLDERKAESIENQKQIIEEYVRRHNDNPQREFMLKLTVIYEDKGMSGTNFDRPGFQNLMEDAKAGKINCIIVKDLSRFGRDYLDGCNYIENVLPFLGIRFIAISDNYDSMAKDASRRTFEVRLKNLTNQMYALDGSEKITAVKSISQKNGSFVGSRCPYGYRAEWKDGIRTLVPAGDAAFEVQQMFALYLEGATISNLLDYLYEKRVNRPKEWRETGKTYASEEEPVFRWRRLSVQDILRNVVYTGNLAQGKIQHRLCENQEKRVIIPKEDWIVVENTHMPLVGKTEFERASKRVNDEMNKQILQANTAPKQKRKNDRYENVFSDVIYCGDCGRRLASPYYQSRTKDVRRHRYSCRGTYVKDSRRCAQKSISEDKLTEIFRSVVRKALTDRGIKGKKLTQANEKAAQDVLDEMQEQKRQLMEKKAALDAAVQQAYFDVKHEKMTLEQYQEVREEAQAKAKAYEDKAEAIDRKRRDYILDTERQNTYLRSLLSVKKAARLDRELVNAAVDSIYLYADERVIINLKIKGGEERGE